MTISTISTISNFPPPTDTSLDSSDSGDIGAEFAALAVKTSQTDRHTADQVHDEEESFQESQEEQQIDAMRKKAGDIFGETVCEGIATIGSAAASYNGGGSVTSICGTMTAAGGKVAGGFYGQASANDDADAAQHKASADHAANAAGHMQDASKSASDSASSAIEFYREYESTRAASLSAALHRA